jgi:hypothetical protein
MLQFIDAVGYVRCYCNETGKEYWYLGPSHAGDRLSRITVQTLFERGYLKKGMYRGTDVTEYVLSPSGLRALHAAKNTLLQPGLRG